MAKKRVQASVLSLLLVVSAFAIPVAGAFSGGSGAGAPASLSAPTTVQATDQVDIWERAALPLRADPADATTTVTNPSLTVNYEPEGSGPVDARKAQTAVYSTGTPISLSFQTVTLADTSQFNGRDVQLVAAHIEPDSSTSLADLSTPTSIDEARNMLTSGGANDNASFTIEHTETLTSGSMTTTFTPQESGAYVLFLATNSTGQSGSLSATNGDLSVTGNVTVIGMDGVLVQQSTASVTPSSTAVTRGNSVDFQVAAPSGTDVNHTVVLYRKDTWTNAEFQLVVKNQLSTNMDSSDFLLKHSIDDVQGVADFDGSVSILGATLNDGQFSGTTTTPALIDFIAERASGQSSGTVVSSIPTQDSDTSSNTTLFASAAGIANADGSQTLTVQTQANWTPGAYRWVYIGGGRNSTDLFTQTGQIVVRPPSSGTGPPPNTGPPAVTPPTTTPPRGTIQGGSGTVTVTSSGAATRVTVSQASAGASVILELPTESRSQQLSQTGAALNSMRMNFRQNGSFDANVTYSATKPQTDIPDVSPGQGAEQAFGYINVEHSASDDVLSEVTFQFSVSKAALQQRGVAPGDVMLFRYNSNQWTGYGSSVVGEDANSYTFESTVPGLSVFAIGSRQQATTTFDVTEASVSATTVDIAEDFQVTATVENTGNVEGTFTINLTVDGEIVEQQSVTIPAHETTEVSFTWEFAESGEYSVGVSGTEAGTVTVNPQQTTTTTPPPTTTTTTPPPTTTTEPPGGGPVTTPAVAFIVLLVAVLGAGVLFLYRQGYFE